jgi:hypothetical protein
VTHADPHSHGHAPVASPFTDAEVAAFQAEDRKGAAAVVGLMAAIFSIGFFLYLAIAIIVWPAPVEHSPAPQPPAAGDPGR